MQNRKWKNLLHLSIILFLAFAFKSNLNAQDIDRLYFQDTITALSPNTLRHSSFVSITDSFSIVISDHIPGRLHFIKLDSNDQVIEARSYTVPNQNRNIGINSTVFHQGYIYFVSEFNNGIYGKLDTDLNLLWLKKIAISASTGNNIRPKSICAINNNFYIASGGDEFTVISRFDLNGNHVASKKIRDFSGFGAGHQTMVTDDTSLFVIAQQGNFGSPKPVHIYKFNPWLSKSRDVVLTKAGIYSDEIIGFNIIERKQNLRIDFLTPGPGGISTFFTVKVNKDLFIEDTKKWDASINNQHRASSKLQTLISGNEFYKIFPFNGINLGGYIISRSYLGWIEQFKFHSTLGLNNDPNYKYLGVNRNKGNRNFYRYLNGGITDTVQTSIIEIVKTGSIPLDFPCDISENMQIREFNGFNIFESFAQYNVSNFLVPVIDLTYSYSVLSTSQSPWCVNNTIDTCALINVRIPNKLDTVCTNIDYEFNTSTYFIDSLQWKINGIETTSSNSLRVSFDSAGLYTISVEAHPEQSSCFIQDSFTVIVEPKPVLLTADTTICTGDSVFLESFNSEINHWTNSQNIQCDSCASTWVIANNLTRVIWRGQNNSNCIISEEVEIETFPIATGSISGPKEICPGSDSIEFTINSSFTDSIIWWVDTIGIINSSSVNGVNINWPDSADSANIYAVLFDENACIGDTVLYNVNLDAKLKPDIAAVSNSYCFFDKDSINYSIRDPLSNANYNWSGNLGKIEYFPSFSEVVISWDSVGNHFLSTEEVVQTNIANCYGTDTVFLQIKESPRTQLVINGPDELCVNVADTFNCNLGDPGSNYIWTTTDGFLIQGLNSDSIIHVWFEDSLKTLSVREQATNGCRGKTAKLEIDIKPTPTPIAEFDSSIICIDDTFNQQYTMSGFDSSSYVWQVTNGEITSGQGTKDIVINWDLLDYKRFKIVETSKYGCISDTLEAVIFGDFSNPQINYINIEEDNMIRLYLQINKHWTNPNLLFDISRRTLEPEISDWEEIGFIAAYSNRFTDRGIDPQNNRYQYTFTIQNSCNVDLEAPYHSSIFLKADIVSISSSNEIQLNWNPYENWEGGTGQYEVYSINTNGDYTYESTVNETRYIPRGTEAFVEYCYIVKALNQDEEIFSWSNQTCISKDDLISIPNVITPNGDGFNDVFEISNLSSYSNHQLTIYNRFGKPIFESNNYQNDWPNDDLNRGTYFYSLKTISSNSGESKILKGWLEVLK